MPRTVESLEAQIAAIDARLLAADSYVRSAGVDGSNLTHESLIELTKLRNMLQRQLDRISGDSPMVVNGRLKVE